MTDPTNSENLPEFLEDEIREIEKTTRKSWIGGAIFGIFLISYLTFAMFMLRTFLDPANAVLVIIDQVEQNAPEFLFQTEQALRHQAPLLAEEMSATFLAAIPKFRRMAQEQLAHAHRELIPYVSWEFQMMLRTYIKENSQIIEELVGEDDIEAFAQRFTDELIDQLGQRLDETLEEDFGGRNLAFVTDNLLLALKSMDEHLAFLVESNPTDLGHKELLQRRILAVLTRRVIEGAAE